LFLHIYSLYFKTSVLLHNLSKMRKSQHSYEHPAVFIKTTLSLSLRTSGLFHFDLQSKFRCSTTNNGLPEFVTNSWTNFILNILFFLLYFIDFCHWELHSEHPVFFLLSGDRNGLFQPEFVMKKWDEKSLSRNLIKRHFY
jgi:hypothetical protein